MINLLPYDNKKQIRAARQNVVLIKCLVFLMFGVIFVAVACTVAYSFLKTENSQNAASSSIQPSTDSSAVIDQANEIKSDLAVIKSILDQRIVYSDVITNIASALPAGSIIENISLNNSFVDEPIKISVRATTQDVGQLIKDGFAKLKVFSQPTILNIKPIQDDLSTYPYAVTVTVKLRKTSSL